MAFFNCLDNWQCLVHKNLLMISRNRKYLFFFLFSPITVIIYLFFYQMAFDHMISSSQQVNPPLTNFNSIPKCQGKDCITIGYATIGNTVPDYVPGIMKIIAERNNLVMAKDIKQITTGSAMEFQNYIAHNPNVTQIAVIFCTDQWDVPLPDNNSITIPCKFQKMMDKQLVFYTLAYNMSLGYQNPYFMDVLTPYPVNEIAMNVRRAVDEGIIQYFGSRAKEPKISANFSLEYIRQGFPKFPLRFYKNFSFIAQIGSFFFYIPIAISFLIVVTEMLFEKDKKLKEFMIAYGMKTGSYWFSWILVSLLMNFYLALLNVLLCNALGWQIFNNIPMIYMIFFYALSSFGMNSLGFFLSSVCTSRKTGYTVSYGFLLISFVFQVFMANPNSMYFLFTMDEKYYLLSYFRQFAEFYPGFNYVKLWADFTSIAGTHYAIDEGKTAAGRQFVFDDLFNSRQGELPDGSAYLISSPMHGFFQLARNVVLYLFLAWYFDNILDANQGIGKGYFFFLRTDFWFQRSKQKRSLAGYNLSTPEEESKEEQEQDYSMMVQKKKKDREYTEEGDSSKTDYTFGVSEEKLETEDEPSQAPQQSQAQTMKGPDGFHYSVNEEKVDVAEQFLKQQAFEGIIVKNMNKTYVRKSICGKKRENKALKRMNLAVASGEVLSILGQNGAGKTTLINILTGHMHASKGRASIFGLNLEHELDDIRKIISLCPQFDICWDDLTIEEHLVLFCKLRKIEPSTMDITIDKILNQVQLVNKRNQKVKALSGGMRRRLSIAIATIGSPKVIFFDEPTTGLDPITQNSIMDLIKQIKKDKVIIMTTHLMEEAEALSDRVMIMDKGNMLCIGSSLQVRQDFGTGYKISVSTKKEHTQKVKTQILKYLTKCKLTTERDQSMEFQINDEDFEEVINFFKILEQKEQFASLNSMILDWNFSHCSLEEVFMSLTADDFQESN